MPELPEVETVVRALRAPLVGATIVDVVNDWPRHVASPDVPELKARIYGCRVERIWRRAKFLVFDLSCGETLIVHLRMSGHLAVVPAGTPTDPYVHTTFLLDDDRELRFRDVRKFGKVYLVHNPDDVLGELGPEPLAPSFTVETLRDIFDGRQRVLKPFLLDQHVIAGIGNIYADEALFHAGIRPTRRTDTLSDNEISALHGAIRHVLRLGIEREGASIDTYVLPDGQKGDMQNAVTVFRRTGYPCYTCGAPIKRITLGGRSTHFCPHCQQ